MTVVRVYLQSEYLSDIALIEIDENASIVDLERAALKLLPETADVSGLKLSAENTPSDYVGELRGRNGVVKDLGKERGVHIHLHRCENLLVDVHFGADDVQHKFSPATTVGRVRAWAGDKLKMQPGDIAEHVLQIAGTNEQPDVDVHIGTLTKYPKCSIAFDLVPAHRING